MRAANAIDCGNGEQQGLEFRVIVMFLWWCLRRRPCGRPVPPSARRDDAPWRHRSANAASSSPAAMAAMAASMRPPIQSQSECRLGNRGGDAGRDLVIFGNQSPGVWAFSSCSRRGSAAARSGSARHPLRCRAARQSPWSGNNRRHLRHLASISAATADRRWYRCRTRYCYRRYRRPCRRSGSRVAVGCHRNRHPDRRHRRSLPRSGWPPPISASPPQSGGVTASQLSVSRIQGP